MGNQNSQDEEEEAVPRDFTENPGRLVIHRAVYSQNDGYDFLKQSITPTYTHLLAQLLTQRDALGYLPFHHAIAGGNLEIVRFLYELYAKETELDVLNVTYPPSGGGSNPSANALIVAIMKSKIDIAEYLLQLGAKVDNDSPKFRPLVLVSTSLGFQQDVCSLLNALVASGADINLPDAEGLTPIAAAILAPEDTPDSAKHKARAIDLILSFPQFDFDVKHEGNSLMFLAIDAAELNVVKKLVEARPQCLDHFSTSEQPPLFQACELGFRKMVVLLLELGASLRPLYKTEGKIVYPLECAVTSGVAKVVKVILEKDPEVVKMVGTQCLRSACQNRFDPIVDLLLNVLSPPHPLTSYSPFLNPCFSTSPLSLALLSLYVSPSTPPHLPQAGADPNQLNEDGESVIYSVLTAPSLIKVFNKYHAELNIRNTKGFSPLYVAAGFRDNLSAVKELIAGGADTNLRTNGGATPLHSAAHRGHQKVVSALIKGGADVNAITTSGKTPFSLATAAKQTKVLEILLLHGSDGK
eukprot:TRINITY_DN787_c0_g1_i2.p1 TRINITY_DN787_c0_g1~~TRINITY_DN787_c0_g1_i2.p1  ORF type:complete len:525 (-),score=82.13 TRINITY_DN787_c0_g1_i2:105-1679(-)